MRILFVTGAVPLLVVLFLLRSWIDQPAAPSADSVDDTCLLDGQDSLLQSIVVSFPDYPSPLSSDLPTDAYEDDGHVVQTAKRGGCPSDMTQIQRLYDIFSWQNLLALNWPVDDAGTPKAAITDDGLPRWTTWKEVYEVFLEDGSEPAPWGAPRSLSEQVRVLQNASATAKHHLHEGEFEHFLETDPQKSAPVWDQNGNEIFYESLLNKEEFDYIVQNELYNLEGQIAFSSTYSGVDFPFGDLATDGGPIELKLAWKEIVPGDIADRYFTMGAHVMGANGVEEIQAGLIGMHIGRRTVSSKQWVWSTFEHVDNVQVDGREALAYAEKGQVLKPTLFDADCAACPVNVLPESDPVTGLKRTQTTRVIPISRATADLNLQVRALLAGDGSVWQYYELVGTQYATDTTPATGPNRGYPSVTNRSGGNPSPAFLTNTVMETYFQIGNQMMKGVSVSGVDTLVFKTESCAGCHFGAGIAHIVESDTVFVPGTADFSWLFTRAARKK